MFVNIRFPKKCSRHHVWKIRVIQCTIQNWDCIWIVHPITLVCLHMGYINTIWAFLFIKIKYIYIHFIYRYRNIHIFINLKNNVTHEFWPPRTSPDRFWVPTIIFQRKKYARCCYTNVTCLQLAKTTQKVKLTSFLLLSKFHTFQKKVLLIFCIIQQ